MKKYESKCSQVLHISSSQQIYAREQEEEVETYKCAQKSLSVTLSLYCGKSNDTRRSTFFQ